MAEQNVKFVLTATDKTQQAFASAKRSIGDLNSATAGLGRALSLALPALGVGAFVAFAKSSIDAADESADDGDGNGGGCRLRLATAGAIGTVSNGTAAATAGPGRCAGPPV